MPTGGLNSLYLENKFFRNYIFMWRYLYHINEDTYIYFWHIYIYKTLKYINHWVWNHTQQTKVHKLKKDSLETVLYIVYLFNTNNLKYSNTMSSTCITTSLLSLFQSILYHCVKTYSFFSILIIITFLFWSFIKSSFE